MRRCASKYLRYTALRLSAKVPCANNERVVAAKTLKTHPATKWTPLPPTNLFNSIVESCTMEPDVVVAALKKVRTNTMDEELASNTRLVIDCTIPLVQAGDARGKQQALFVFVLLCDNDADRSGMMKKLKEAVACKAAESVVAARFQELRDTFAPLNSWARWYFSQAERDIYDVTGLEKLIPRKGVNVIRYLEQTKKLFESKFFKGRRIWRLTDDHFFDRHVDVEPMANDPTVGDVRGVMYDRAALLYGESGSGKTTTAILSCEEGDLCIFMTPQLFASGEIEAVVFGPDAIWNVLERRIRKTIPYCESLEGFTGNVVIVFDEAGSYPSLVRALCRQSSSIVRIVKEALKVAGRVGLVVCGSGCEDGDLTLGSYPSNFTALRCDPRPFKEHVIELMAKKGFAALAELLNGTEPTSASYYYKMSIDSTSVVYVQRLMLNRRFCAALLCELERAFPPNDSSRDDSIPWLTVLPVLVSGALLSFKRLSALQSQSWDATLTLFARALAYCFGGAHQAIAGAADLQCELGMLTDNAKECTSDEVDVVITKLSNGLPLALPWRRAHYGRRMRMSAAMAEMGLQGFSLSTVTRSCTDAALETTITDWIYCWCLACCSDVPTITLLGEKNGTIEPVKLAQDVDDLDKNARQAVLTVMMGMRDALRAPQLKTAVVLRVSLTEPVESVAAAEEVAFAEAWALIGEADVPFVLVARNAPLASFTDVFVVAGRTRNPSVKEGNATALFVAIQVRHNTKSFDPTKAGKEHRKPGADAPRTAGPIISLVLVLHPNDHKGFACSSAVNDGGTTVWIRSGALASVMHPISLGADPQEASRSSDAEKCDLRNKSTEE